MTFHVIQACFCFALGNGLRRDAILMTGRDRANDSIRIVDKTFFRVLFFLSCCQILNRSTFKAQRAQPERAWNVT